MKKNAQVALKSKKGALQNVPKNNSVKKVGAGLKAKQNVQQSGGLKKNAGHKILVPPKKVVEDEDDDDEDSEEDSGSDSMEVPAENEKNEDESEESENGVGNAEGSDSDDDDDDDEDESEAEDVNSSKLISKNNGSKFTKQNEEEDDDESDDDDNDDDDSEEQVKHVKQQNEEESDSSDDEAPTETAIKKEPATPALQKGDDTLKKRKVFVKRLHPNTLENHIRKHFASCGELQTVTMRGQKGVKSEAIIVFATEAESLAALKLHNTILNDCTILVEHAAQPRTKLVEHRSAILKNVGGLTKLDGSKLSKIFKNCGEIQNMSIVCEKNVLAYITFKEAEGLQKAMKLNGTEGDGFKIDLAPYSDKAKRTRVFVKNIAKGATENDITKLFQPCGEIVKVMLRQNDPFPATAVVQFANEDGYCKAFILHEEKLRGQSIYLEPFSIKPLNKKFNQKPQFAGKRPAPNMWKKGPPKKTIKSA